MNASPLPNDLFHTLIAGGLDDAPRHITREFEADPTVLESSIISACLHAGYTKDEIKALLHWQQAPEHGLFTSREEPTWQITDGRTWRSLRAWVADYRAEQEVAS